MLYRIEKETTHECDSLKIAPSYESGKLGVAVTIDETTNDHDVDIIVPSEWI